MPAFTFPLEVKETILDLLAEDDKGHLALKTCSLVCQAFLPICRKHIFESIVLNCDNDQDGIFRPTSPSHAFGRLLRETPEIADYIRKLDYNILAADKTSSSIQESLKRISRLEFLSIRYHTWPGLPGLNWRNNPIRPTLLHLLHLPTLTHFKMMGMNDFIVSDLIPCVNLEYLDIGVYTTVAAETTLHALPALPENSIKLNEFVARNRTSTTVMKFCSARRPDGQPIIDFGSLTKITVALDNPNEALQELFRRCHTLTNAHISFRDPRNVRPSLSDMLRPSMQTLRDIVVNIHVVDDGDDSLLGIPSELKDMRTENTIETITIKILVRMNGSYCQVGEDWGRLDEILTFPGWSSLKRVSLAIEAHRYHNGLCLLEEAMRKLPETQFPRLSSSKSISLDIKVNTLNTETE